MLYSSVFQYSVSYEPSMSSVFSAKARLSDDYSFNVVITPVREGEFDYSISVVKNATLMPAEVLPPIVEEEVKEFDDSPAPVAGVVSSDAYAEAVMPGPLEVVPSVESDLEEAKTEPVEALPTTYKRAKSSKKTKTKTRRYVSKPERVWVPKEKLVLAPSPSVPTADSPYGVTRELHQYAECRDKYDGEAAIMPLSECEINSRWEAKNDDAIDEFNARELNKYYVDSTPKRSEAVLYIPPRVCTLPEVKLEEIKPEPAKYISVPEAPQPTADYDIRKRQEEKCADELNYTQLCEAEHSSADIFKLSRIASEFIKNKRLDVERLDAERRAAELMLEEKNAELDSYYAELERLEQERALRVRCDEDPAMPELSDPPADNAEALSGNMLNRNVQPFLPIQESGFCNKNPR
jgi:hypothetical protein